jgi:hypothetical protein
LARLLRNQPSIRMRLTKSRALWNLLVATAVLQAGCGGGGEYASEVTSAAASDSETTTTESDSNAASATSSSDSKSTTSVSGRSVLVRNSEQLSAAIAGARPGDVITLADGLYTGATRVGSYTGSFTATTAGTAEMPITLTGTRNAVIDGHGTGGHYGIYLVGANYWRILGLTVTRASKGIVLDSSSHVQIEGVLVSEVGDEAIHLRQFSSDNLVQHCDIAGTGRRSPQYGEGVYIGSANSNWTTYTNGLPDRSDRNRIIANRFSDFTAEAIDIKEGSSHGVIADNSFDGSAISGKNYADSWVDVKGNGYRLSGNRGVNTLLDAFQVHSVCAGWGYSNVFSKNIADVNASGYGFNVASHARDFGNIIYCNNVVSRAGAGFANVACVAPPP